MLRSTQHSVLISILINAQLRQLRNGYTRRPRAFPHALCMIGLRDIRDYRNVKNTAEILIKRRDTHLDQLADKLTEPRVERIIQSILIGEETEFG